MKYSSQTAGDIQKVPGSSRALRNLVPSVLTFEGLVTQIQKTLAEGRSRAQEAVDLERARTYWETGKWIHVYILKGSDRAKYGEKLFSQLAERTGVSETLLGEIHLFYRSFPISPARGKFNLCWADYRRLLRIKDSETRFALAEQAAQKDWTSREVETAVRKIQQQALLSNGKGHAAAANHNRAKLIPRKGKFFTYTIVRAKNMHEGAGGLSLDLGFKGRREIDFKELGSPRLGEIVQVLRTQENPAGDRYKVVRGGFKRSDLYTYEAKAQIFYDADTFWADIDQGFRNWTEQKLRLRGIDAVELGEEGGKKAAAYVKKVLSKVPFIVITISGRDKFGRPLADIFYLPGTVEREKVLAEGQYLNQELLDLGLAQKVKR